MAYLRTYPFANDTLEGIAEWWISRQRLACFTEEIESVVSELTARGVLEAHRRADGRISYRPGKVSPAIPPSGSGRRRS